MTHFKALCVDIITKLFVLLSPVTTLANMISSLISPAGILLGQGFPFLSILCVIIGLVGVAWGADRFTDGAGALARRMGVPQIVIGLTIVGFGTSAPELFVSLTSALRGQAGMALGNIVGSNIFNVLFIVGISAAITPIAVARSTVSKDIPWAVGAAVLLLLLCLDGKLSRIDAAVLLAGMAAFFVYTLRMARHGKTETEDKEARPMSMLLCVVWIIVGLACLVVGSQIFVSGASDIARQLGVSDAVIGLTIVAGGTSLPELATSVVSARKGQSALAIGNVIGSNVFNILMILGITGAIQPLRTAGITMVDFGMMIVSILLMWQMSYSRFRVSRGEGCLLVVLFAAYMTWLVVHA